jgi:hypothetical protein
MKRLFPVFALTALAACNTEKHELMDTCITRVQADSAPSATAGDIKEVCKRRVNSYLAHGGSHATGY